MQKKFIEESIFRFLPSWRTGTRRKIHADDRQLPEIRLEIPAFGVELGAPESDAHRHCASRIQRDAAVAAFDSGMNRPMRLAWRDQWLGNVLGMRLDFLQADDIPWLRALEPA